MGRGDRLLPGPHGLVVGPRGALAPGAESKVPQPILDQAPEGPELHHTNLGLAGQVGLLHGSR